MSGIIKHIFAIVTYTKNGDDGIFAVAESVNRLRSSFAMADRICANDGRLWRVVQFISLGDVSKVSITRSPHVSGKQRR